MWEPTLFRASNYLYSEVYGHVSKVLMSSSCLQAKGKHMAKHHFM